MEGSSQTPNPLSTTLQPGGLADYGCGFFRRGYEQSKNDAPKI